MICWEVFFSLALVTPTDFMEIQLLLQSLYTIPGRSLWMSQVTSALIADAIFFAGFSASASPHMPTKPHDGPLTVGCTAAQRCYPCHVRVSWSPDPCWCSSCAMTGRALQRSVICYPWNREIYLFLTLVCYIAEKKKVSQGWGLNIFWFLFCMLIVFSMSKLLPTGSQIHLCGEEGVQGRQAWSMILSFGGLWEEPKYGRCWTRDTTSFSERPAPQLTNVLLLANLKCLSFLQDEFFPR